MQPGLEAQKVENYWSRTKTGNSFFGLRPTLKINLVYKYQLTLSGPLGPTFKKARPSSASSNSHINQTLVISLTFFYSHPNNAASTFSICLI